MFRASSPNIIALVTATTAFGQVNLPEGFEVVQVDWSDEQRFGFPSINDCGEIVWHKGSRGETRIYYYDNGRIERLTDYNNGLIVVWPKINEPGDIVWMLAEWDVYESQQVVLYRNGEARVMTRGSIPAINNLGHMSWDLFGRYTCQPDNDPVFYNGRRARIIERSPEYDQSTDINDRDQVVWMHTDFCAEPWAGDIRLYENGEIRIFPAGDPQVSGPHINNLGHVVWNAQSRVELWDGKQTRVLTDQHAAAPDLNDQGDVYLVWWDTERETWQPWLIRTSEQDRWYRLAENELSYGRARVNKWGEVAGVLSDYDHPPSSGIWYMRRIRNGDSGGDGVVDRADYAAFAGCMTGPGRVDRLCDCRFLDLDHDGDVDMADFTHFQIAYEGED